VVWAVMVCMRPRRIPSPPTLDWRSAPAVRRPPRAATWWIALASLAVAATAAGVAWWLLGSLPVIPDLPPIKDPAAAAGARNEIVRTALAAAAGVGAAITLALAFRRQRHAELVAAANEHDATERRVTELYTKAAEQLGNDQAPVRLAGLYALERLAQDTPALRQTIVDVICSYLRMPYAPPREDRSERIRAAQRSARDNGPARSAGGSGHNPQEERQVRLTAQRILTAHLRYDDSPAPRRRWSSRRLDPNLRHWPDSRLDLAGAVLIDFDLSTCRVGNANFRDATFTGDTGFNGAHFSGGALFEQGTFTGGARFDQAHFSSDAVFAGVIFSGDARFDQAYFSGDVLFERATFSDAARFSSASFCGSAGFTWTRFSAVASFAQASFSSFAGFREVIFLGVAGFGGASFSGAAGFDGATFSAQARFDGARFPGGAEFGKATFASDAGFDGARGFIQLSGVRLAPVTAGVHRVWPPDWRVEQGADGWQTLRPGSAPISG
jgi:uncharacterized protein YjbI with pentapeptide repeats